MEPWGETLEHYPRAGREEDIHPGGASKVIAGVLSRYSRPTAPLYLLLKQYHSCRLFVVLNSSDIFPAVNHCRDSRIATSSVERKRENGAIEFRKLIPDRRT